MSRKQTFTKIITDKSGLKGTTNIAFKDIKTDDIIEVYDGDVAVTDERGRSRMKVAEGFHYGEEGSGPFIKVDFIE